MAGTASETFEIDITLPDVCDPPAVFSVDPFVDQAYTIGAVG